MSTPPDRSHSTAPLSPQDRAQAERVASRLRSEWRRVLAQLPADARSASALSRELGVERTSCQRLVSAMEQAPGVDLLAKLPGLDALRLLRDALARRGAKADDLDALDAAVDEFEQFLRHLGRSKTSLGRGLFSPLPTGQPPKLSPPRPARSHAELREAFFDAAAEVAGRWSDVHSVVWCIGPAAGRPELKHSVHASAFLRHESRALSLPFVLSFFAQVAGDPPIDPDTRFAASLKAADVGGRSSHVLLEEFSSQPLPRITGRQGPRRVEYTIDPDDARARGPLDLVLASRSSSAGPSPAVEDPPLQEIWYMSSYPARHLIFDVYLERELAQASIASLSTHAFTPGLAMERDRWSTRVPQPPRLTLLGEGLEGAHCDAYPRQRELVAHLLDSMAWDPDQFVGFRCEVAFPLWRVGYCMRFDFSPPDRG